MTAATVVYSDRTTNWPVIAAAVAGGVTLGLMGRPWAGPWPGMAVPIAIALVILVVGVATSTSLRVTAGPRGVQVRWGVFGWPRFRYAHERISRGEVVTVSIWRTWNWGVNWTPRDGWTFMVRSGPALRLTLSNGRRVTIGLPDPEAALAALCLPVPSAVRPGAEDRGL